MDLDIREGKEEKRLDPKVNPKVLAVRRTPAVVNSLLYPFILIPKFAPFDCTWAAGTFCSNKSTPRGPFVYYYTTVGCGRDGIMSVPGNRGAAARDDMPAVAWQPRYEP